MINTPLPYFYLTVIALPAWLDRGTFFHYLAAAIILIVGLVTAGKTQPPDATPQDRLIALAPTFLAIPMAVFGVFHLVFAKSVAEIVPSWIPGHLFWAYFVGVCLIAGAFSLVINKFAGLAATLFGIMLLLFELFMHIPALTSNSHDRMVWAVAFRDLAFSGGFLALAATRINTSGPQNKHRLIATARFFIAIPILFFAVEQFLHPEFAPGVPLEKVTPTWIPAHSLWGYLTAAVYLVAGLCLIVNQRTRSAATVIGFTILLLCLVVYLPIVVAIPGDIANGLNYLVDTLLLSGSALALAGTQDIELPSRST